MVRGEGKKSIKTVWIFCEGAKTEKYYFDKLKVDLRLRSLKIKVNSSNNKDPVGIIKHILNFKKHTRDFLEGDLIFCVFDRDANSDQSLLDAKKMSELNDINLIFSNPCFEFWILSHFECYMKQIEHGALKSKLDTHLGGYKKTDPELYTKTKQKIGIAVKNSKQINDMHYSNGMEIISRNSNPSTLVFELVETLQTFNP
ncbi:hypothetical protein J2755_001617 [Methanohalophilus levihalophilus]|uniref:RloB family protein n=1 Tax=Methanohalophilus levihalophilus TaxID=1431282 RepID=UPI001AE8C329|nr:RloB family protein [Methanohalophilus levihalophilus]MBP2030669.1 hypothetical protein [Methanohalophilus levihalophilus]